ncbi:MAG: 50S ribosomal protein L32 [Chloroflexota bacterium]|nr:50S ribosomal protein L32 [Chloroflexota bacterium]MXY78421.1 50S ribosomal protein L32 [Chloroflexota bacterium]
MAPLPKRKYAKTRQRLRRQHLKQRRATLTTCPTCPALMVAHQVCYTCGRYRGRQVLESED